MNSSKRDWSILVAFVTLTTFSICHHHDGVAHAHQHRQQGPRGIPTMLFGTRLTSESLRSSGRGYHESTASEAAFVLSPRRRGGAHQRRDARTTDVDSRLSALRVRGGGDVAKQDESDDSDDETEQDEEKPHRTESGTTSKGALSANQVADDSSDHKSNPLSSVISMEPVLVTVRTATGNPVLDQSLEMTVHRSRDVASLKQSISRQLPGRPPVSTIQLIQGGVVLKDELMVDELVDDDDVDDDDEDEEGEQSGGVRVVLQLDMVPPVDPKFISQLGQRMDEMTVSELLDAFAMNEAAAYLNTALLVEEEKRLEKQQGESLGDGGQEVDEETHDLESSTKPSPSVTSQLKEQAARIRKELEETILHSEQSQKVIKESRAPAFHLPNLQEREVRGQRVRLAAQGGVKTTLKRKIQRNLNVNWPDTLRHCMLFIFFGWFGGRTPLSRAILLLGAPSVFLLQARPVKLWIRQILYAISDHPPSIFLSLLPAPQQAILSLDVREAMKTIYGDFAPEVSKYDVKGIPVAANSVVDEEDEDVYGDSDDYSDDDSDEE